MNIIVFFPSQHLSHPHSITKRVFFRICSQHHITMQPLSYFSICSSFNYKVCFFSTGFPFTSLTPSSINTEIKKHILISNPLPLQIIPPTSSSPAKQRRNSPTLSQTLFFFKSLPLLLFPPLCNDETAQSHLKPLFTYNFYYSHQRTTTQTLEFSYNFH